MKKRITAFTLFLMMICSLTASAATPFTDITEATHPWAYEAVTKMSEAEVIKGTTATTFSPDTAVTRIQALLLMARIIGYNSDGISDNKNTIYSIYDDELSKLSTTYKNELAFLAFAGVFTTDDFLNMDLSEDITREEAAVFLAKVDGVSESDDLENYKNAFSDDSEIAQDCKPYVYYVRDKGYMTGVAEGIFSPKTTVTRAQIATMLYRILPNIDYTYENASIDSVDVNSEEVKVYYNKKTYELPANAVVRNNGETIDKTELYSNLYGIIKVAGNKIMQLDVFFDMPVIEKEIDGLISHIGTTTNIIQIQNIDSSTKENYNLLENRYRVIINGEVGKLSQLRTGDYAVLGLDKGNRIVTLTVADTSEEYTDLTIEKIEVTDSDTTMTVKDSKGKTHRFDMNKSEPEIRKNGNVVAFSSLSEGDKISKLTLLYNRIKSIDVFSEITSTKGSISTIHISDESYIVIKNGGEESKFNLAKDTTYYVYGEKKSIYDLQLGQNVSITMDGKNVDKIEVTLASQTTQVIGTVLAVNTTGGFITVKNTDGETVIVYVSTKANTATKIIDNNASTATNKTLKNIDNGASITALGALVNGVFEATTIVYSNN